MVDVRVDPAVRHEPEQVDTVAPGERRPQRLVLEKRAVGNGLVDAHEVLVEPPAGADRQVPDLGVAHLSRRKAGGFARCLDRGVRILVPEAVELRRSRQGDGGPPTPPGAAPPREGHEGYERTSEDARQIAAKESTSSEAPPTRAPSTEGCASRSAAFSGLTEPPYSTGASSSDFTKSWAWFAISGVAVLPVPIAQTGS